MCSLLPYFFGGPLASNCLPTDLFLPPHIPTHTFLLFCLPLFLGLCVFLSSTFPPPYPTPSSLCLCVSTCTSSLLSHLKPFEVWDSSKSNMVLFFWTAMGKWLRKRGSSSITAVNQKSTLPSMAWCEKWFWFSICQSHYMLHAQTYMKIYCTVHLHTLNLWAELENENSLGLYKIHTHEDMQERTNETENRTKTLQNIQSQATGSSLAQCNSFTTQI